MDRLSEGEGVWCTISAKKASVYHYLLTINPSETLGCRKHSPSSVWYVTTCLTFLLQKQSLLPSARKALTASAEGEVKGKGNVVV